MFSTKPILFWSAAATLALAAAPALTQDERANDPLGIPRAGDPAQRQSEMNDQKGQKALSTLQRAHEDFRNQVTFSLWSAARGTGEQVEADELMIASVGDDIVIAGAPAEKRYGMQQQPSARGTDPLRPGEGLEDAARRADGSLTSTGQAGTGQTGTGQTGTGQTGTGQTGTGQTGTGQRDPGRPTGDAIGHTEEDRPGSAWTRNKDGECLGIVMISTRDARANGFTTSRPSSDTGARQPGSQQDRSDAGQPIGEVSRGDMSRSGIGTSHGMPKSGIYSVRVDGDQVLLYGSDNAVALSVPLINADAQSSDWNRSRTGTSTSNPFDANDPRNRGDRDDARSGQSGTGSQSGTGQGHTGQEPNRPGSPLGSPLTGAQSHDRSRHLTGQQQDWAIVFNSIVLALNDNQGRRNY